jgi:hypothetical protein
MELVINQVSTRNLSAWSYHENSDQLLPVSVLHSIFKGLALHTTLQQKGPKNMGD